MSTIRAVAIRSFILLGTLCAPNALAQGLNDLVGMAMLTGNCEKLVMAGTDMSEHCEGKILQSIYKTGRTGFTLTVGDKGSIVTFSGMEGAKPDADSQLQSVDKVILNLGIEGVEPAVTAVTGGCSYSNPYLGPMTISCHAMNDGQAYLLEFRTDGSEPHMTDLSKAGPPTEDEVTASGFKVGGWLGSLLRNDEERGCLMTMPVNSKVKLMVYANANEAFTISIFNDRWDFAPDDKVDADILFDGSTYPINEIEVRNPRVLTIHGGSEEDSMEAFFRESSELEFRRGREQIRAKLTKSSAAANKLWACAEGR